MSKKSEDSLERFFRKAVKQYDTGFMESDWRKMEKMLDEEAMESAALRAKYLRRIMFSLAGLLLLSASVYFLAFDQETSSIGNNGQTQVTADAATPVDDPIIKNPTPVLPSQGETAHVETNSGEETINAEGWERKRQKAGSDAADLIDNTNAQQKRTENRATHQDPNAQNDFETHANLRITTDQPANKNSSVHPKEAAKSNSILSTGDLSGDHKTETAGDQLQESPAEEESPNPENTEVSRTRKSESGNEAELNNISEALLPVPGENDKTDSSRENKNIFSDTELNTSNANRSVAPVLESLEQEKTPPVEEEKSEVQAAEEKLLPEDEEKVELVPSRWSIGIAVAPDFTRSALGNYTSPGEAFGVTGSYRFFRGLSISTGFFRSTKKYEGRGSDYSPPAGYWVRKTNGIIPEEITGTCLVYEIPVTVQYSFLQREKHRAYVVAGVSNYVMASQRYKYSFAQDNPGAASGWSTSESDSYPFNIGHVSIGYERNILPKWALGIEPYLKIPFAGMGWSDVDLFSTGIFINIRYRIFKKEVVVTDGNKQAKK